MNYDEQEKQRTLPIDFHEEIFRNVLQDPRYGAWKAAKRKWQLHISGGPGSGKTTLAAVIALQLRREINNPVALIHVHDDIASKSGTEATLQNQTSSIDCEPTINKFVDENGCLRAEVVNVSSSGKDLKALCRVLSNHLNKSQTVYLVVDGYDRVQYPAQVDLQQSLGQLQANGLQVLLFNAASKLDEFPPPWPVTCDGCSSGKDDAAGLRVFWTCELCPYDLCDTCRATGKRCHDHSHTMFEPYNVVNMKLDLVPSELEHFVRTDLEAEYGEVEETVIEAICEPSDGNINLVKLRLDQIRDLDVPPDILLAVDRLPREVVAFFDAEIKRISVLDPIQRYQTLLAIIAVASEGWMSVSRLEQLLAYTSGSEAGPSGSDYPLVRQALQSARGLLSSFIFTGGITLNQGDSDRHRVAPYIRDLGWYIREDYNQDLVLAKQYLRQAESGERRLDRSHSFNKTSTKRKQQAGNDTDILPQRWETEQGVSEVSSRSIIDPILQEPGDICIVCQKTIFRSMSNTGVGARSKQDLRGKCPICLYIYNELERAGLGILEYHWSRRTMGRTSNSNSHLVLTLTLGDSTSKPISRRLVFMLKSELGTIAGRSRLGETTTLEHTGDQIQKWLHTCKTEHVHCNHHKVETYVPKRLVDIETGTAGHCRVIDREEKIDGPYVTLSHSWGRNPDFLTLTTKNKKKLMTKGLSISELRNKNFEEAIEVARHLEVRYIWIDSLCICQAGREKDFKEEGQYMHLVYQNSFCNIVAADSKDATGGLFRNRPTVSLSGTNTPGSWIVLDKELWAKELLQSPIYTRGWVFQERMLSPRIVHFTRSQVFWDCSTVSACETVPEGLPFALSALATTDRRWRGRLQRKNSDQNESNLAVEDSLESFWKTAVLNYTSCELTNQADKTFAIWSVAKLVRDSLQLTDQYGCGLWSIALHEQLAWQVKVVKQDARMDTLQSVFPSWSWASVNAPVQIQDRIVAKRCYTIKNHQGTPISFGDFKDKAVNRDVQPQFAVSDSLAVHGYLIDGQLHRDPSSGAYTFESSDDSLTLDSETIVDEIPDEALLRLSRLHLLPLVTQKTNDDWGTYAGNALVLIKTGDYRSFIRSRLMKQVVRLVIRFKAQNPESDRKSEVRMLRFSINALNAYLHRVAKQDRELPSRKERAFRRVGVVHFNSLDAAVWAKIRTNKEELIWLD